jgi:hypothetical protein
VSADLSSGAVVTGATGAVRIQVVFHTSGEHQAQTVAAMLIDRAHEIANLPECECDVDVSVETSPRGSSPAPVGIGGAAPSARPSKS